MIKKVRKYMEMQHMIEKGDRIVMGISGGADSVALMLMLLEMKEEHNLKLFVVHINHGIRVDASQDADYVKELCGRWKVPFYLFEADIPALAEERGLTEEEMGRVYRYEKFSEVMKEVHADKLAVAHHMDDQAETMLFHLVRGSRISGMEGMHPVARNSMGSGTIIRPLLQCRKRELVDWLKERNISWQEDCTNGDDTYSRNRIRNRVIPELEQVNAQAVAHMAQLAEEMSGYQAFLQKMVWQYMEAHVIVNDNVPVKEALFTDINFCETNRNRLKEQEPVLAKAVIYEMLCTVCGKKKDIGSVHVQAVYDLLEGQSGRKISLPYGMEAEISYEMMQIRKSLQVEDCCESFEVVFNPMEMLENGQLEKTIVLPSGGELIIRLYLKKQCTQQDWENMTEQAVNSKNSYTKFFECDTIKDTLCVRTPRKDDYFVMNANGSTKKLSRFFIDQKVPVLQRSRIPVVAHGSNVLWIVGRRRCEEYKVKQDSRTILMLTYKGE